MAYPKPMLYVIVVLAFVALLWIIYQNNQRMLEPFGNREPFTVAQLAEKFQTMSSDQKKFICSTLTDQLADLSKKSTDGAVLDELKKNLQTLRCSV